MSDLDYKNKYLKYKNKYLNFQNQTSGGASLNTSQKQKSLIQKHKRDRKNLALKHKNELKIQAQNEKKIKDIIVRDNKVELMGDLSMYVINSVAQKLMKKQQQEVKNLAKKHARERDALKA
jgi:hypothetical protein